MNMYHHQEILLHIHVYTCIHVHVYTLQTLQQLHEYTAINSVTQGDTKREPTNHSLGGGSVPSPMASTETFKSSPSDSRACQHSNKCTQTMGPVEKEVHVAY